MIDSSIEQVPDDGPMVGSVLERRLQYSTVVKRKNRTLLTDKSTRRGAPGAGTVSTTLGGTVGQLEKIPEGSFKKKGGET